MTTVNIEDYIQSSVAKKIEIEVIQYTLNTSAVCNINFLDSKDNKISSVLVYIENSDFTDEWVSDSDLVNIVCRKLGLTQQLNISS